MTALSSLSLCYLILLPYHEKRQGKNEMALFHPKGAPYFYEHDIKILSLGTHKLSVGDIDVQVSTQIFDNSILVADCRYVLPLDSEESSVQKNTKLQQEIREWFFAKMHVEHHEVHEVYTIILCHENTDKTDHFVNSHAEIFAHFIRGSFDKPLDKQEIESIVSTRVRYSTHDVTVVDWNGAVVVSDDDDFQSEIDIFKIGNYQLMRYRMLDSQLEEKLTNLQEVVDKTGRSIFPRKEKLLQDIVSQRLSLLLNFEKLDQSILLIGDWYTSKLYKALVDELYVEDWKTIVQNKLESLRSIHEVVTQNLTVSWSRIIDLTSMTGWFILLIGYFILMYFDFIKR